MGDHSESIRIEYDADVTSYSEMLEVFWKCHSPFYPSGKQYRSAIYYHNEEQKKLATATFEAKEKEVSQKIYTAIEKAEKWTDAEGYHQKYYLRGKKKVFKAAGLSEVEVITSPLACKLNGFVSNYIARYGSVEGLKKDILALNPPEDIKKLVL
mmetsp:Transcript_2160/g.2410  ORF Transcript_2160/g.2410 Transcript_2160/m.2410 type:complete len:154 (+) Transcript_2160:173-634(+)